MGDGLSLTAPTWCQMFGQLSARPARLPSRDATCRDRTLVQACACPASSAELVTSGMPRVATTA